MCCREERARAQEAGKESAYCTENPGKERHRERSVFEKSAMGREIRRVSCSCAMLLCLLDLYRLISLIYCSNINPRSNHPNPWLREEKQTNTKAVLEASVKTNVAHVVVHVYEPSGSRVISSSWQKIAFSCSKSILLEKFKSRKC